ncbi:alpha/beta hydrolase family esterase [Nocardia sp. NPDC003693]
MASSLFKRMAALVGATCAAMTLAVSAAGSATADDASFEDPSAMAAACSTTPKSGDVTFGQREKYRIHVPSGISASGAPLVVAIHGGQSNPATHQADSGWNALADSKKFIVVYPRGGKSEGTGKYGWAADTADVNYIKAVVANVRATYCVAPTRIHLSGHSNGGQMASRAGCVAPELFASGAVYAPAPPPTGCNPARAISWGVFASASDPVVFEPVAYSHVMYWSWENRPCSNERGDGGTDVKDSKIWDCADGTKVLWRVYNNGSHEWPTGSRKTEMLNRMWSLFQANPRP